MGSIRFTSFLYGLILIISLHSFAYCHQAMEIKRMQVAAANEFPAVVDDQGSTSLSLGKDQPPFDPVPAAAEATNKEYLGSGRKMMIKRRRRRIVLKKKQMLKLEQGIINEESSLMISGEKGEKQKTINYNLTNTRRSRGSSNGHQHRMKVRMSTLVALNADYHVPKSHPPKNN